MTSHAAVVARGMGKPCMAGCGELSISEADGSFRVKDRVVKEGDWITSTAHQHADTVGPRSASGCLFVSL